MVDVQIISNLQKICVFRRELHKGCEVNFRKHKLNKASVSILKRVKTIQVGW